MFDTTTVTYYAATLNPGDTTVYDNFVYDNPTVNVNAAYYTYYFDGQLFDVKEPVVLQSVVMYFNNMFNVVVVIKDDLGNVVSTTNVPNPTGILNGRMEVALNVRLSPGTGYSITAEGSGGNGIMRNLSGAVYPYAAVSATNDTLLSVTGTINGLTDYLYFFYDWKVLEISNDSISSRVPVTGYVNTQPIIGYFSRKVCQDTSLTLNATVNALGVSYEWNTAQITPQIQVNQRGLYSVTVTIPVNTFPDCVRTWQVQVDTFPRTFISIIDTSYLSCAGDVADNIDIKLSGGKTPYDVYWTDDSNPGTYISTTLGTTDTIFQLANMPYGSYSVLVRDNNRCKSELANITITEPLPLGIQLNYLDSIICNGEPTGKLEAVLSGGRQPYTYEWSTLSGTVLSIDSLVASELQPNTYVLSLVDTNGCQLSDTIEVNFIAGSVPLNYDSERYTSFGANSELWSALVLFDQTTLTPYYDNYFIEYVSAYITDEDSNIVEAILRIRKEVTDTERPFIAGTHWTKIYEDKVTRHLKGINGFKCIRLDGWNPVVLESGGKYLVEIEFLMKDGTIQVLGLDAGAQPNSNGAWLLNMNNPQGTQLTFNRNFNMRLTLRDIAFVGVEDVLVETAGGLTVYPNPANNEVTFAFQVPNSGEATLRVFDLQGKEVFLLINERLIAKDSQLITWDTQHIPAGMYIGVLQTPDQLFTTKLLIAR